MELLTKTEDIEEEQAKIPTIGERSKAKKDTQAKVESWVRKISNKRQELQDLEDEYFDARKKAEAAEKDYNEAIKTEHRNAVAAKKDDDKDAAIDIACAFPNIDLDEAMRKADKDQAAELQQCLDAMAR